MAQAGRSGRRRKQRKAVAESLVRAATLSQISARTKRGVVEGATPEKCPVCKMPSEGWLIEAGRRTWYHFGRAFNCIQKYEHTPAESGDVPDVQG